MLAGTRIIEAFTQEKDKLFLKIPVEGKPDFHLVFDTSPLSGCMFTRDRHFKAKKNTINFFSNLLPAELNSIRIAEKDRSIKFSLKGSDLLFIIKGSDSNVFLSSPAGIESFKKSDLPGEDIPGSFVDSETGLYRFIEEITEKHLEWKSFSSAFPFAGKDLFLESKACASSDGVDDLKKGIHKCIESILRDSITVYYDYNNQKAKFIPESFLKDVPENETIKKFDSYFSALHYYFQLKFRNKQEVSTKTKIEKYLDSEMEKISSKLNNLKFRIEAGSKETEYRNTGNLLLMNMHLLTKGLNEIIVEEPDSGIPVKIKLDPKIATQKNIDRYFEKSKDEKINFEQSKDLYDAAAKRINRLNEIKNQINSGIDQDELEIIYNKLKINRQSKADKMEDKCNYKHYLLHGKYHVYVGKDSRNNDELTTQFAKQNDLWFHARGSAGSHVVLRVENTKEAVPKNIIKEAASLAAYFSKAKTSGVAPVSYTFRKYVHKKKGLEPGQVILSKESVVLVKPEIPKECEPVITDLI